MPMFIDWHKAMDELPQDLKQTVRSSIDEGKPDEFGVIDRGLVLDRETKRAYCILEAPNEEAVRLHHKAAGVDVEAIHPADAIL